jgi:hypothetical protein
MNSGTITKKPVTKLRRSHPITRSEPAGGDRREQHDAGGDPVPRERRKPGAPDQRQERPHDYE